MKKRFVNTERTNGSFAADMPDILELPWFADARLMLQASKQRLVLLVGEPGTGKTTFAHHATLANTGQMPEILSGSPETEPANLFGRWTLVAGETRFLDGPLPRALKTGSWLLIEEFSLIPLQTRALLLPLRDLERITNPMNEEVLQIPSTFRLLATSNSESMTCRRNTGIAEALYDGFLILETTELSPEQVTSFLRHHFPSASDKRIGRVLEVWQEYRDLPGKDGAAGKNHISYRSAAHLLALLELGMDETRAIAIAVVNKFMATDPDLFSAAKLKNSLA